MADTKVAKKMNLKRRTKGRGGRKPGVWVMSSPEAFKAWRTNTANLSRSSLANLIGVSSTSIQNWETSNSIPSPKFQRAIQELMDAPPLSIQTKPMAPGVADLAAAATTVGDAVGNFLRLLVLKMGT